MDPAETADAEKAARRRARAEAEVRRIVRSQDGVISRRQVLDTGLTRADVQRRLRRREWVAMDTGVYVDHTGTPSWDQRCWAAVLRHEPAALAGHSAMRAELGVAWRHHRDRDPISLQIDTDRHVEGTARVRVARVSGFADRVHPAARPPRLRIEHAVVDLAAEAPTDLDAIGLLADACQAEGTTAGRIRGVLVTRRQVPRKQFLLDVLDDIDQGTCSVLEHGYLTLVERPHALPIGSRQEPRRMPSGLVLLDCDYAPLPLRVELDSRLFHGTAAARDPDLQRDLEAVAADESEAQLTVRLGWGQVFGRACTTAGHVTALLRRAGWDGRAAVCDRCRAAA